MQKPSKMRTIAIVNPAAGGGRGAARWADAVPELRRSLSGLEQVFTAFPGEARELSRKAALAGYDLILAAGGDGTASEVATGIYEANVCEVPPPRLLLLPLGTGCDFLRGLAPGRSLTDFCRVFRAPLERSIDVGRLRFLDHNSRPQTRIFLNVASFGCGGRVARAVSLRDKRRGGRLGFQLATARALARYKDQRVTLRLGNLVAETRHVTNFAICNGRYFGGGMLVAPKAEVDDGQFDLTQWAGYSLLDFLFQKAKLYDGRHLKDLRTASYRCPRLAAESDEPVLLEADGEYVGQLPATFEVLPRALRVLLPALPGADRRNPFKPQPLRPIALSRRPRRSTPLLLRPG